MNELDPLLHSQLRLAIMSILLSVDEADFVFLKEKIESSAGNLSIQLEKLSSAGDVSKETYAGIGSKNRTVCRMTDAGRVDMQNMLIL